MISSNFLEIELASDLKKGVRSVGLDLLYWYEAMAVSKSNLAVGIESGRCDKAVELGLF
jgi:hypothetical protein